MLHVVPPNRPPFEHSFQGAVMVMGRASASDLVLPDLSLSRQHAKLFWKEDQLMLVDCQSRNGTFVNGNLIQKPVTVAPGDWFQLSETEVEVREIHHYASSEADMKGGAGSHTILRPVQALLDSETPTEKIMEAVEPGLRRYAERLMLLNEVHEAAARPMALEALLDLILELTFGHLGPESGAIYLRGENGGFKAVARRSKGGRPQPLAPSQKLVSEVAEKGLAALVFDTQTDQRFSGSESIVSAGIRSLVAAPIMDENKPLGLIVLASKAVVRLFSEEDLHTLVSVAAVASLKIRNAKLVEEAAQRRVYQRELALARKIQVSLLPRSLPCPVGYEIEGRNLPSQGVSGDFYQVTRRALDGQIVLMVADVSGKGIAASLLVSSLEALAAGPVEDGLPPDAICAKLSRLLFARTSRERYATLFLGVLQPETGKFCYTNAGHPAAILVRKDLTCEALSNTGVPIGIFKEAEYEARETFIEPGETLVLFTDGLIEARNQDGEEYGRDRLRRLCVRHAHGALEALVAAIDTEWEAFAQDALARDDRTMVLLRRHAVDPRMITSESRISNRMEEV